MTGRVLADASRFACGLGMARRLKNRLCEKDEQNEVLKGRELNLRDVKDKTCVLVLLFGSDSCRDEMSWIMDACHLQTKSSSDQQIGGGRIRAEAESIRWLQHGESHNP